MALHRRQLQRRLLHGRLLHGRLRIGSLQARLRVTDRGYRQPSTHHSGNQMHMDGRNRCNSYPLPRFLFLFFDIQSIVCRKPQRRKANDWGD